MENFYLPHYKENEIFVVKIFLIKFGQFVNALCHMVCQTPVCIKSRKELHKNCFQ